jgi:polyisoprenoid-binding protein YceI
MSWKLDTAHTQVQFSVRHLMISKVRGEFQKVNGTIELDEANPGAAKLDVQIETSSVNTRDAQRDGHLRSADFFNSEVFPLMTFKSSKVEVTGASTATVSGDLTIRDVTKPVKLEVEFLGKVKNPWGMTSAGFTAHTAINREDWNLTWNVALETGGVLVGKEIEINIEAELIQVPEGAPAAA